MAKRIDGKELKAHEIIESLNRTAGENGIGRIDIVENRFVGMKSRGVYETPGCTILHTAHRAMESITMDREVMHLRDSLITKVSELIYYGFWYSPEMEALRAFTDQAQKGVTGTVRLKLYKGNVIVVGRKSEKSLYKQDFATFDKDAVYDQKDASGFIKLNALRLRIKAMVGEK
jgi:argininosuccinate synthase